MPGKRPGPEAGQDADGFKVTRSGTGVLTDGDLVVSYNVSGSASSGDYRQTLGGSVTTSPPGRRG